MSTLPPETAAAFRQQYDLAFQISPIILQGGIATNVQGGLLPIVSITPSSPDQPFATFMTLPGSTLISQSIGMYPFANQAIAANATIQQPLTLSMVMVAPVNQPGGYLTKLQAFTALQKALSLHNASGGMYTVATPAFIYQNLLMTSMTDVSNAEDKQKQIEWQLDFIQPVLTVQAATAQQSALMQKISAGAKFTGPISWSGNSASSPANFPGVAGALGNVNAAIGSFGGSI